MENCSSEENNSVLSRTRECRKRSHDELFMKGETSDEEKYPL